MAKKKQERKFSPIIILLIITLIIALLSFIGSLFSMQGDKTSIVSGTLETSLITVKNVLSYDGIKYIFNNIFNNYQLLEPVVMLIFSIISLSVFESSGLLDVFIGHLKKRDFKYITFITLFVSIISSI